MLQKIKDTISGLRQTELLLFSQRETLTDLIGELVHEPVRFREDRFLADAEDKDERYAEHVSTSVDTLFADVSMLGGAVIYNTPLYPVVVKRDKDGVVKITCRFFDGGYVFDPRPVTVSIHDVRNPEAVATFCLRYMEKH